MCRDVDKKELGGTNILPLIPHIGIHAQPLHDKHLGLLLDGQLAGSILPEQSVIDGGAEESSSTSQPEENQVKFTAGEKLNGDVEEAGIAGAEGEGVAGEAELGDVAESGGEDGRLRVGVFVVWGRLVRRVVFPAGDGGGGGLCCGSARAGVLAVKEPRRLGDGLESGAGGTGYECDRGDKGSPGGENRGGSH